MSLRGAGKWEMRWDEGRVRYELEKEGGGGVRDEME